MSQPRPSRNADQDIVALLRTMIENKLMPSPIALNELDKISKLEYLIKASRQSRILTEQQKLAEDSYLKNGYQDLQKLINFISSIKDKLPTEILNGGFSKLQLLNDELQHLISLLSQAPKTKSISEPNESQNANKGPTIEEYDEEKEKLSIIKAIKDIDNELIQLLTEQKQTVISLNAAYDAGDVVAIKSLEAQQSYHAARYDYLYENKLEHLKEYKSITNQEYPTNKELQELEKNIDFPDDKSIDKQQKHDDKSDTISQSDNSDKDKDPVASVFVSKDTSRDSNNISDIEILHAALKPGGSKSDLLKGLFLVNDIVKNEQGHLEFHIHSPTDDLTEPGRIRVEQNEKGLEFAAADALVTPKMFETAKAHIELLNERKIKTKVDIKFKGKVDVNMLKTLLGTDPKPRMNSLTYTIKEEGSNTPKEVVINTPLEMEEWLIKNGLKEDAKKVDVDEILSHKSETFIPSSTKEKGANLVSDVIAKGRDFISEEGPKVVKSVGDAVKNVFNRFKKS